MLARCLSLFLLLALALCGEAATSSNIDFNRDIRPILSDNCIACHGPDADKRKGKLRLDEKAGAEAARKDGDPAIVPGHPEKSEAFKRITTKDEDDIMPPAKTGKKLTPAQISLLERWIKAGAPYAKHWAFEKPKMHAIPEVKKKNWPRNDIDRFVLARLEKDGIEPSKEADRATLLRRVSLDLIGLQPTPEDVAAFVADKDSKAYEKAVNRLLESPHYGERWGRHWLDVARYADSNGYSIDAPRSIWKYRDWVIGALNKDMPFDQFTVEQLAGDLLPDASADQIMATGFHRNTQINEEGGIDKEQFRIESVVDRVNTTGAAFLGLTLGCAQCHDHKFDPIAQREYYQMFAFLNDQDEPNLSIGATPEQAKAKEEHEAKVKAVELELNAARSGESDDAKVKEVTARLNKLKRQAPKIDTTMVLSERKEPRESYIHIKGDFTRKGDIVQPGVLGVLHAFKPAGVRANRLDLAKWIVDPENPLTPRVIVNRMWQQYFGRGIVETENDFGSQGTLPTHPELLDYLATKFIEERWSMKKMHKLIVTSATYRQSSNARPDLETKDPRNYLLARQNRLRLEAEIVRDVALNATGLLHSKIGGPSVFPPQPEGVMNLGQSRREWKASAGPDRYRRGMYTYFWRATPHPSLTVFDAPDSFSACTRRIRSNTPLQALTLLNDEGAYEFAQALGKRLMQEASDHRARVERGFQLCLSRAPHKAELDRVLDLVKSEGGNESPEAWTTVARVLLNLDETITRE